ncbi:hypothetical protein GOODEAATRI_021146 [Goodea atripinnis]|uniref:Uncharacterized protein n=1 Tax=Goodea atripinnis TaxID=208336 RepID=A0ABV0PQF2_9TELE
MTIQGLGIYFRSERSVGSKITATTQPLLDLFLLSISLSLLCESTVTTPILASLCVICLSVSLHYSLFPLYSSFNLHLFSGFFPFLLPFLYSQLANMRAL